MQHAGRAARALGVLPSALLTGAGSWRARGAPAPAAARALVGVGDSASPWAGAALAWPAVNRGRSRGACGGREGARRRFGVLVPRRCLGGAARAEEARRRVRSERARRGRRGTGERAGRRRRAAVVAWACDGFATAPGGSDDGDDDLRGAARGSRGPIPGGRDPRSAACARPAFNPRSTRVQPPRRTREERRRTRRGRKGTEATRAGAKPSCTRRARSRRSRETSSPRKPFGSWRAILSRR